MLDVAAREDEAAKLRNGPVLSVRDLTTSFRIDGKWKSVVRNMSFDIAPRETVERLLQAIKLGVVAHGDKLPPERELAVRLVSRR